MQKSFIKKPAWHQAILPMMRVVALNLNGVDLGLFQAPN
jgi:hypothetical protein